MAQKVTAMDIRAATAFAGQIENVSAFCRREQISRQTFYKWRRRFRDGGLGGLEERSRRPNFSPGQTAAAAEEAVLRKRKQLLEQGLDHGPQSIVWALQRDGVAAPSRSTTWRILTRYGLIVPQPQKATQVGDQTVLLHPAQRMLAVRLDDLGVGRWHRGGYRRQSR